MVPMTASASTHAQLTPTHAIDPTPNGTHNAGGGFRPQLRAVHDSANGCGHVKVEASV
jgi:hypothetical protein